MSNTQVFKLSPAAAQKLRAELNEAGFEFRKLQHALFQARGEGVVASMYRSGKLVVQGSGAEAWHVRYLGATETVKTKEKSVAAPEGLPDIADSFGSDEAGKGDTFGGLTVCAVAVPAESSELLMSSRVADSKSLNDDLIGTLSPWIKENFPFALRVLGPAEYNQRWQEAGSNVNKLLAQLHFECLKELHDRCGFLNAVVDRFSPSAPVSSRLRVVAPQMKVVEVPRAERHAAVAAASVIARDAFLTNMQELSQQWAMDFPLGSGAPVPRAMRKFLQLHSAGDMQQVTKIHFKNVQTFLAGN
ncbi:MAG: ribonuclease HIII [Planctomycetes bacterium]|nr:ribonuclease HIII [Planctomycetota bacterium]MCP4771121.1 ribonuclease HIII [Planctomycetota bacterium]MCP4860828.1 ribonuclease HIII [Planctomycetota bacterium]